MERQSALCTGFGLKMLNIQKKDEINWEIFAHL